MTMIDSKLYKQYQQASAAIRIAQEKHAGSAIIQSAYDAHYEGNQHVETIIVYVYVGNHVTEMRFTPSDQLAERLPAIIDNVVGTLVQVKEAV